MDLSVIIPAYNESGRIESTLAAVTDYLSGSEWTFEVLVVDDGSEDGTAELVGKWRGGAGEVRVLSIPHQGKGAAVAAGVGESKGRWVLMSDADLSTPIDEWPKLARLLSDGVKVAVGSRQIEGATVEKRQPWLRQRLGLMFGGLVRYFFPVGVIDSQCGFKAFESSAAKELFSEVEVSGYCFDIEILLLARSKGYKVVEVPVRWKNHPDSRVKVLHDLPGVLFELWSIRRRLIKRLDDKDRDRERR